MSTKVKPAPRDELEQADYECLVKIADSNGYGTVAEWLREACAERFVREDGYSKAAARKVARAICE